MRHKQTICDHCHVSICFKCFHLDSYQQATDRLQELRKENEELKSSIVASDELRKRCEGTVQSLQKENTQLESQLFSLETEVFFPFHPL